MRHRARRPVLDRLRGLLAAHRAAAALVAVLTATAVTGVALTAPEGPDSARTGSSVAGGQAPSYPPDQTPGSTSSATPDAGTERELPTRDASPTAVDPTRAERQVSRGERARPTDDVADPASSAPSPEPPSPEPSATATESPAADAPQTTATTRSANAGRWVIGVSSDTEATYECSLDGGAYQPCGTTVAYDDLEEGTHSFAARATDGDGDTDPSPATLTAEVDSRGRR